MNKSAIVIGGGMGGLFTAAILSKEGLNVTVIEKNRNVGGGLQSFTRFGEVFDAGMHIIGGMHKNGSIHKICNYLGILDKMHYRPVDDDCIDELYFAEDKKTYKIAKGREGFVTSIAAYFPGQHDNIKRYVDAMFNLTEEMDLFYLRPASNNIFMHSPEFLMSVKDFIAKYIDDRKLQSVLSYMNPLYAGHAETTPAYIHAIINVLYINGACRFEDGCYLFAEELKKLIEANGGNVISGDGVCRIYSEDKKITGVKTISGKEFTADYYISAIHPCTLISMFDDEKALPKSYRTRLSMVPNSYSAFTIYIKLKPNRIKYFNHTNYYMSEYDEIWNFNKSDDKWPRGMMYMTTPEHNQGEYTNKMLITSPMMWDNVKQWENTTVGRRGEEYEAWKKQHVDMILAKMTEIYPDFLDCIESVNSASPLTIRDYYGVKEGAMYGFAKDCTNIALSQLPVVTKIPNLLLTGQNNNLHGFCGVPLTAINTCEAILGINYLIDKINKVANDK